MNPPATASDRPKKRKAAKKALTTIVKALAGADASDSASEAADDGTLGSKAQPPRKKPRKTRAGQNQQQSKKKNKRDQRQHHSRQFGVINEVNMREAGSSRDSNEVVRLTDSQLQFVLRQLHVNTHMGSVLHNVKLILKSYPGLVIDPISRRLSFHFIDHMKEDIANRDPSTEGITLIIHSLPKLFIAEASSLMSKQWSTIKTCEDSEGNLDPSKLEKLTKDDKCIAIYMSCDKTDDVITLIPSWIFPHVTKVIFLIEPNLTIYATAIAFLQYKISWSNKNFTNLTVTIYNEPTKQTDSVVEAFFNDNDTCRKVQFNRCVKLPGLEDSEGDMLEYRCKENTTEQFFCDNCLKSLEVDKNDPRKSREKVKENHHQKNKVPSGSTVAQLQSSVVTFPLDLDQTIEPREFDENNLNSNKEQSKRRETPVIVMSDSTGLEHSPPPTTNCLEDNRVLAVIDRPLTEETSQTLTTSVTSTNESVIRPSSMLQQKIEKPGNPLSNEILDIFIQSQFGTLTHANLHKKLTEIYDKEDGEKFIEEFIKCSGRMFTIKDCHPFMESSINFAAQFVVKVYDKHSKSNDVCHFFDEVFDYLLRQTEANDTTVRFRAILFVKIIMHDMYLLDSDLCEKLATTCIHLTQDKQLAIRLYAVRAMHRLQDPQNPDCKVMRTYYDLLSKDPSVHVQKIILQCLAKNEDSLREVIRRTRDIDESVRDLAYVFISKVTLTSVTISTRNEVLSRGLNDRSEKVRETVKTKLLVEWLKDKKIEGDVFKLLQHLDLKGYMDTAILALNCLFEQSKLSTIMTALPINKATKLIEELTAENVIYWRCLIAFLAKKALTGETEKILPELSVFCEYISEYVKSKLPNWTEGKVQDSNASETSERFIVEQLLEIAALYDFYDEAGRENLMKLIAEVLVKNKRVMDGWLIDAAIGMLEKVVPDIERRQELVVGLINELGLPTNKPTQELITLVDEINLLKMKKEKLCLEQVNLKVAVEEAFKQVDCQKIHALIGRRDEITYQMECIQILIANRKKMYHKKKVEVITEGIIHIVFYTIVIKLLQAKDIRVMSPMLKDLLGRILKQTESTPMYDMNLTALTLFCQLDIDVNTYVDILSPYSSVNYNSNILEFLAQSIDSPNPEIRCLAVERLSALMLDQKIEKPKLLSRYFLLNFNRVTEDETKLRQHLSHFFKLSIKSIPYARETIEEIFIPTLNVFEDEPHESSIAQIDQFKLASFMITLMIDTKKRDPQALTGYKNDFAYRMVTEILKESSKDKQRALISCLKYAEINTEDKDSIKVLKDRANDILEMVEKVDEGCIEDVRVFISILNCEETAPVDMA